MAETTEQLIERLVTRAVPVRRLRPPLVRAVLWLISVAVVAGLAVFWLSDLSEFAARPQDPKFLTEMVAALSTGIVAILAAFQLSYPDRSSRWMILPLPFLALWIASSGYACYQNWIVYGAEGWEWGESAACFLFILGTSVPLAITLLVRLRRSRPLAPVRVAAVAGLGVAAVSAFLLQFFHPFDITFMDLSVHAVAVGLVVLVTSLSGRFSSTATPHI
jgi:hypothetical protein